MVEESSSSGANGLSVNVSYKEKPLLGYEREDQAFETGLSGVLEQLDRGWAQHAK